jgi:hypothetical protein
LRAGDPSVPLQFSRKLQTPTTTFLSRPNFWPDAEPPTPARWGCDDLQAGSPPGGREFFDIFVAAGA